MDNDQEMTRLHRLTRDEADLIHEYRLLGDEFAPAVKDFISELVKYRRTKAMPPTGNVMRLFPG